MIKMGVNQKKDLIEYIRLVNPYMYNSDGYDVTIKDIQAEFKASNPVTNEIYVSQGSGDYHIFYYRDGKKYFHLFTIEKRGQ